jgi:hypothetical protein
MQPGASSPVVRLEPDQGSEKAISRTLPVNVPPEKIMIP